MLKQANIIIISFKFCISWLTDQVFVWLDIADDFCVNQIPGVTPTMVGYVLTVFFSMVQSLLVLIFEIW